MEARNGGREVTAREGTKQSVLTGARLRARVSPGRDQETQDGKRKARAKMLPKRGPREREGGGGIMLAGEQ